MDDASFVTVYSLCVTTSSTMSRGCLEKEIGLAIPCLPLICWQLSAQLPKIVGSACCMSFEMKTSDSLWIIDNVIVVEQWLSSSVSCCNEQIYSSVL